MRDWVRLLVAAGLAAAVAGCEDPVGPDLRVRAIPDVRRWVTEDIAEALDEHGHFVFRAPPSGAPADIDFAEATAQAEAFVKTFLVHRTGLSLYLEGQRGATIDFAGLSADGRVFYASAPYPEVRDTVLPYARKVFGPYMLVHTWNDHEPVVSVAVSALNDDIGITPEGYIDYPDYPEVYGNDFSVQAVKPGTGTYWCSRPRDRSCSRR